MTTDPNDIARYLLSCAKPVIIPCIMNNLVVFLSLIISLKPSLGKIITNHDAVAAIYDTNTPEYGDEYPFTTIAIKIDAIATNTAPVVAIRNPFMNFFLSICCSPCLLLLLNEIIITPKIIIIVAAISLTDNVSPSIIHPKITV